MRNLPVLFPLLVALGHLTLPTALYAQAFIEHVWPPAVQRGHVTRVTLVGSEMQQVVGLWTSLPAARLRSAQVGQGDEGKAIFDLTVAPDAPLGFYGLRLATASGLSNVHLFLVDDLPTTREAESSEQPAKAQPVTLPVAVAGICREAEIDRYAVQVQSGQRVSFEVVGSRFGKDFDPLVIIRDERGRQVAQHDNDVGLFFDCRFEHVFARAGTYVVEVCDSRYRGSDHWTYVLRMGTFPVARVALPSAVRRGERAALRFPQLGPQPVAFEVAKNFPLGSFYREVRRPGDNAPAWVPLLASDLAGTVEHEPNDKPEEATVVSVPGILHGSLDRPGDHDWFAFDLAKGQTLVFRPEARGLGSPADLVLELSDPAGKLLQRLDVAEVDDPQLNITASAAGRYRLLVQDVTRAGGPEYVYRIEVRGREPKLELTSEAGRLAIPQGTRQPLPLILTRTDYAGPVDLRIVDGPPGLTLQVKETPGDEKAATKEAPGPKKGKGKQTKPAGSPSVNFLSADASVPVGVYTVQVEARAKVGEQALTTLARTHPLLDRLPTGRGPHGEPFELREDQRRLPPTLTDRIAVVVTPPAPFDFNLSDAQVVLPRYLSTPFRIETTRVPGFDAPITFEARGGQLEYDGQRRRSMSADVPPGTREQLVVQARLNSLVQTRLAPQRVTVTGTAKHEGRTISLTRTFDLDVSVAYDPAGAPARVELKPGGSAQVKVLANRLPPFDGPVTVRPGRVAGLALPEAVTIPAGKPGVELTLQAASDLKPGKYTVALPGTARVAGFQEPATGKPLEVIVAGK